MDPAYAALTGFAVQTVLILGLFWQILRRMDRFATKDDLAGQEKRTIEAIAGLKNRIAGLEKRTDDNFAASEKRTTEAIAGLENRTTEAIAASEKRTTEAIAGLEKRTDDNFAASEKRTTEAIAASEKRTTEAIAGLENRTNAQFSEVKEHIGLLSRLVNENRERLILIQGHLGIGITPFPKATPDQPQEATPEKVLASSGRG